MLPNAGIPDSRGACCESIIDSKVSRVVTSWNNRRQQHAAEINALAAAILADGSESNDEDDDDKFLVSNDWRTHWMKYEVMDEN